MILVAISASLWGCLGCEDHQVELSIPQNLKLLCHYVMKVDFIWLVVLIVTPNETLTLVDFAVSASCWGSDVDLYTV